MFQDRFSGNVRPSTPFIREYAAVYDVACSPTPPKCMPFIHKCSYDSYLWTKAPGSSSSFVLWLTADMAARREHAGVHRYLHRLRVRVHRPAVASDGEFASLFVCAREIVIFPVSLYLSLYLSLPLYRKVRLSFNDKVCSLVSRCAREKDAGSLCLFKVVRSVADGRLKGIREEPCALWRASISAHLFLTANRCRRHRVCPR